MSKRNIALIAFGVILVIAVAYWLSIRSSPPVELSNNISGEVQIENGDIEEMLTSPITIGLLWPVLFVILASLVSILVNASTIVTHGDKEYEVRFTNDNKPHTRTKLSLNELKDVFKETQEVQDLHVHLKRSPFESFNIGVDLAVSAIAIDLAIIYTASSLRETFPARMLTIAVSFILFHIMVLFIAALIARSRSTDNVQVRIRATQVSNFLGLLSIVIAFLLFARFVTN